jgi:FkbM family methyltransferase
MMSKALHAIWKWFFGAAAALGGGGRRGLAAYVLNACALPFSWLPALPGFGTLVRRDELLNIQDNFFEGTLRFREMEEAMRRAAEPFVLDLGVNVGVTVRWWFHLNPRSRVVAVDMMREAHEFARQRLVAVRADAAERVRWVECVVSDQAGTTEVAFDDPLFGMNRADAATGGSSRRQLPSAAVDTLLADEMPAEVFLFKVDIEGAGGRALAGAQLVLRRTRFLVVEYHDPAEVAAMTRHALAAGLDLVRANAKMLFFERPSAP